MNLTFDIETIGTDDPEVIADIAAGIKPPATISKAETIAAWNVDKRPAAIEEAVARTSFDGGLGHVICFGYAIDDALAETVIAPTVADERDLLRMVAAMPLRAPTLIGHNISWDIRFLWQRYVCLGVQMPDWLRAAVTAKPWDQAIDTMTMWNPDRDKRISLDKLCRVLGVPPSKTDMDGSKVWQAYKDGEIARIAEYCRADVTATRECYRRMTA